jgi:hypothetical protein
MAPRLATQQAKGLPSKSTTYRDAYRHRQRARIEDRIRCGKAT